MQTRGIPMKNREVLNQLKKLPEEDRIILGLFLYEGLTHDEVSTVMNLRSHGKQPRNPAGKSLVKKNFNTL